LLYCIAPPGWSHDGSRDTSDTIKQKYVEKTPAARGSPGLPPAE